MYLLHHRWRIKYNGHVSSKLLHIPCVPQHQQHAQYFIYLTKTTLKRSTYKQDVCLLPIRPVITWKLISHCF